MKNIYLIAKSILFFLYLLIFPCNQLKASDPIIEPRLQELLDHKNYFRFRSELQKSGKKLSKEKQLYYSSYYNYLFNNPAQSNKQIDKLLTRYGPKVSDSLKVKLLANKAGNHVLLNEYDGAAKVYTEITGSYPHILDSLQLHTYNNVKQLWSALAGSKPQKIHKQKNLLIPSYRDSHNFLIAPVKCRGVKAGFVFDSGATISVISSSLAEKIGLKMYETEIEVGTSTHIKIKSRLGVADTLYIGDLLFENVVFLVSPDEKLYLASNDYRINGIIGFPVIYQMEEIHLYKNGMMVIPRKPEKNKLKNLCLDNMTPIVQMYSSGDTLSLMLDTGAKSTELSRKYYEKHKDNILIKGNLVEKLRGGAGGEINTQEYHLYDFAYTIGSQSNTLPTMEITLEEYEFNSRYDGNLGQDIITQYHTMVVSFSQMYLDFY